MKKTLTRLSVLAGLLAVLASCTEKPEIKEDAKLSLDQSSITVAAVNPETVSLALTSNSDWRAAASNDWFTVEPRTGSGDAVLTVNFKDNVGASGVMAAAREGYILVSDGTNDVKVTVKQAGEDLVFVTESETAVSVPAMGATVAVTVKTNVEYAVQLSADWITQVGTKAVRTDNLQFVVAENVAYQGREATIRLVPSSGAEKTVTVTQLAAVKPTGIYDAEDFLAFLAAAPTMPADTSIALCADIDLTGKTAASAASFAGTLNGAGFALKGLNLTTGLFHELTGSVKDLVLEGTCTTYADADFFGALADKTDGASVQSVVSKCNFRYESSDPTVMQAAGGLIGYARNSTVKNCTSEGSFVYKSGELKSAGILNFAAFSGVVGCADACSVSDLTAKGSIEVLFDGAISGSNFAIANVLGNVSACGTISGCKNLGSCKYEVSGVASKWGFTCGVIGYARTTEVNGCVNAGSIISNAPQYGNSLRVAGVVGCTDADVKECSNEGAITSTFKGNYIDCCGVVGRTDGTASVVNCVNAATGTIDCSAETVSTYTYIGGVAGYVKGSTSGLENYANVTVRSVSLKGSNIGGTLGQSVLICENCVNEGNLTVTVDKMEVNGGNCGGLVGCLQKGGTKLVNKGIVKYEISDIVDGSNPNLNIGGVVGSSNAVSEIADSHNYGSVTVSSSTRCNTVCVGGVNGYTGVNTVFTGCTNEAPVTMDLHSVKTAIYASGVCGGNTSFGTLTNCTNTKAAAINVKFDSAPHIRIGGVAAVFQNTNCTGAVNDADVTVTGSSAGTADKIMVHVGGVVSKAYASAANHHVLDQMTNNGKVTVNVQTLLGVGYVGGVSGSVTTLGGTNPEGRYVYTNWANNGSVVCDNTSMTVANITNEVSTN